MRTKFQTSRHRGSALVMALLMVMLLSCIMVTYSTQVMVDSAAADDTMDGLFAENLAYTGLNLALEEFKTGTKLIQGGGGNLGFITHTLAPNQWFQTQIIATQAEVDAANPKPMFGPNGSAGLPSGGSYKVIRSRATVVSADNRQVERVYDALITKTLGGIYWYAIFAGNRNDSDTYTMLFNGTGANGDSVVGAVYSGNNLAISQNAIIRNAKPSDPNYKPGQNEPIGGNVKTAGTLSNPGGTANVQGTVSVGEEQIPDLSNYNYEGNAAAAFGGDTTLQQSFVDVARELNASGTNGSWNSSGTARQITNAANPAHIFRKNPSDRTSLTSASAGDDYFLEDPTANTSSELKSGTDDDTGYNGNNAYHLKLTKSSDPTRDGNGKVYFVDGNVWINNPHTMSFVMKHNEPDGIKVTIVAKGNVYIGDNLFLNNQNKDGIAFVALPRDGAAPGSTGNVYLGDPIFGTTRRIESFLYADNNFVDSNLDAAGSQQFTILGNMTAGNEVAIQRDYTTGHWETQRVWNPARRRYENKQVWISEIGHSRMDVFFDARIRDDANFRAGMPMIPLPNGTDDSFTLHCIKNAFKTEAW